MNKIKVGVFVGSFDPVHCGHVAIMNYLVSEKIVDKVLVIPTGNYWDKQNLTDVNKRWEMLKLVSSDKINVDNRYSNYQYTYQILEELAKVNDKDGYYLIIGYDNYQKIHLWKNYQDILKRGIIVINRDNKKMEKVLDKVIFIDKNFGEISSTKIREKIHERKYNDISSFLDKKVLEYILENGLYR